MGVKSTYSISRDIAIQSIFNRVCMLTNEQLAEVLEAADPSEYRNYWVLDGELDDGDRNINSVDEYLSGKE